MLESELKKQENSITPVLDDFDELQEIWRKEFHGAKSETNFQREKMCTPQTKFLATPLMEMNIIYANTSFIVSL